MTQTTNKSDKPSRWQRYATNWAKRNWVTDVILYGIQVAAVLYAFCMIVEIIGMICDYRDPHPLLVYEDLTVGGLIFRMLSKGWLAGLAVCIVVFICNRRVIRWKADGILWMFILFFVISMVTSVVEDEMFFCFTVFSVIPLAMYSLSLFLPKKTGDSNTTTFRQCCRPANWLITLSFVIMLMWSILLCGVISRIW